MTSSSSNFPLHHIDGVIYMSMKTIIQNRPTYDLYKDDKFIIQDRLDMILL